MAKKMYHVHECVQDRHWVIMARNKEEAQRLIIEEHTFCDDYPCDGEWEFEFEKYDCFEITAGVKVEMA